MQIFSEKSFSVTAAFTQNFPVIIEFAERWLSARKVFNERICMNKIIQLGRKKNEAVLERWLLISGRSGHGLQR